MKKKHTHRHIYTHKSMHAYAFTVVCTHTSAYTYTKHILTSLERSALEWDAARLTDKHSCIENTFAHNTHTTHNATKSCTHTDMWSNKRLLYTHYITMAGKHVNQLSAT